MTLEKAIEILTHRGFQPGDCSWEDYLDAVKLSLECLKERSLRRKGMSIAVKHLLPGETKE